MRMDHEQVQALFTGKDGSYRFARWARPIVPVVFGVSEDSLSVVKGACEAMVTLAGHQMAETDPELGVNLMFLFFRDWDELTETPNLDQLIPDLGTKVDQLKAANANQYRFFRFEDSGAVQAAFVFLRMDAALSEMAAEDIALSQMAQVMLIWAPAVFAEVSPLAHTPQGHTILRPEIAEVIRAAYDPVMPVAATDPGHALRLAARLAVAQ